MLECWRMSPKDRPSFGDIIEDLAPDLPESFRDNSFYYTVGSDDEDDIDNDDDDFTSAGSNADKDIVGCDDDNDDSDLIHSKTPLHPTAKLSEQEAPDVATGDTPPDMLMNSRGFLMPVRLPMTLSGVLPSLSGRSTSGGSSLALNDRTSLSDLDLRGEGLVRRATPTKQHQQQSSPYKRDTVETTNNALSSSLDRSPPANHRSFVGLHHDHHPHLNHHHHHGGDSQPDVVRAGLFGSEDSGKGKSNHSPRKNGLVGGLNGLVPPPPYTYRTSPTNC